MLSLAFFRNWVQLQSGTAYSWQRYLVTPRFIFGKFLPFANG
jgi:hypothetical protein